VPACALGCAGACATVIVATFLGMELFLRRMVPGALTTTILVFQRPVGQGDRY